VPTSVRADLPAISFDRDGLADVAIEPVKLGWRLPHVDVVGGYDVDVTRGQTVQVQGGIGGRFLRIVDLGVASYALWQTGRDRGSDLPPALTGQRERAVGVGPEIDVLLPWIRSRLTMRYEWEVTGRARLDGSILVVGLGFAARQPER